MKSKSPARDAHPTGQRPLGRASTAKSGRTQSKSRSLWRVPFESRVAAWFLLAIAVVGLAAMIAVSIAMSVDRHRCADLCAEREYAFKDYAPAGRFGAKPAVCTCSKEGVIIKLPMG